MIMERIEPAHVDFNTAILLKEKGFDEECKYYYDFEYKELSFHQGYVGDIYKNSEIKNGYGKKHKFPMVSAPEQWEVIEWFFKKYKYSIEAELNIPESGEYDGCYVFNGIVKGSQDYKLKRFYKSKEYPTREKALSDAILHTLINLI